MTQPVPQGYHTATPVLFVTHLTDAIEFYRQAFAAEETGRLWSANGKLAGHEVRIGDSRVRVLVEAPERDFRAPTTLRGRTGMVHLYLPDAAEVYERVVAAGGKVIEPLTEQYWGDLSGILEDPYGHRWVLASRVEDLTAEEILSRGPTTPL